MEEPQELWVALIGSAPSSVKAAPYHDPRWRMYGCSPGAYGVAARIDEWFELHAWEPGMPWFSPEYVQWMTNLPKIGRTLWTGGQTPVEGAKVFDHQGVLDEFDPHRWFCTSSLFWMMGHAIQQGAKKIGLWGVDMAATEEYEMQRAGIHFLTYIARSRGIEVGVPMESDLFTPRFRYGIDEWTHSFRKTRARMAELTSRRAQSEAEHKAKEAETYFLKGAIDDLKYNSQTWADKGTHTGPVAIPKDLTRGPTS
jgi:hypothetical protein